MSNSFSGPKNYSARSISSAMSLSRGRQQLLRAGGGQTHIATKSTFQSRRALSVYGGAGGRGIRISQSDFTYGTLLDETAVINNEKITMQNLNDRLATYLEKVRSLESANSKLELQIREFNEKRTPSVSKDYEHYYATITDLQTQIMARRSENQSILLQIGNAHFAAEDFKEKFERELNMCAAVLADVSHLRVYRDNLTISISDLESQIEGLKEELVYLKRNHKEELELVQMGTGKVNVEVDSTQSVDLTKILEELREQYGTMVLKNQQELEKWYQAKTELLQKDICVRTTEVKTSHLELSDLKSTLQSLEIERQSFTSLFQCLQQNMEEVKGQYSAQISQYQLTINTLETDVQQLKAAIEQQQEEYTMLLDIKMRLEQEIAEYRRLLEGELHEQQHCVVISKVEEVVQEIKKAVVISKVEEVVVEKHTPHIERRTKIIIEDIVDGVVVNSTVDTQVEDIQ